MKILEFEHNHFCVKDLKDALTRMGHELKVVSTDLILERTSPEFDRLFDDEISMDTYDMVFTFNYSVLVSKKCCRHNIKYVSWIYDSPLVALYSYTITNPCNYIFIFDKVQYLELKNGGINTVFYAPLAVNTHRLDKMIVSDNIYDTFRSDIAFVGSMYNEKHNLFERLNDLPPYTKGYLDAIMAAQMKVYGTSFIEELLTTPILDELQKSVPYKPNSDGIETPAYIYANYFLARKMAQIERHEILKTLSDKFDTALYTHNPTPQLNNIRNRGAIDYYSSMPYVFKCSKINLNISLRSIKSGIPLRAFDIMGAGGFLMTNFQSDFLDYFIPNEDFVYFESIDDLEIKCRYYLKHDEERKRIAHQGHEKILEYHTYEKRLNDMFNIVMNL